MQTIQLYYVWIQIQPLHLFTICHPSTPAYTVFHRAELCTIEDLEVICWLKLSDVLISQSQHQSLHTLPASILHLIIKALGVVVCVLGGKVCECGGDGGVSQHTHPLIPPLDGRKLCMAKLRKYSGFVYCTEVNDGCWRNPGCLC